MNKSHKDSVKKHWRKMNFKFKVALGASERKDKLDKKRGLRGETGESMQELVARGVG